jgi:glycosyltransferase involved in cell wall biosynthesis
LTPLAAIGLSLEEDLGLNYRFALPNKIFDYIQAEVPILVSNLPEMKAVIKQHKVGEIVAHRDPKKLAHQIKKIIQKDFTKELKVAKEDLIWEKQENKLLTIFNNLK